MSESIPLRWRPGLPRLNSAGSLYQFVREHVCRSGGKSTKSALLSAIEADPQTAERLQRSQGLSRLLWNMHHSGWIELDGEDIRATAKTLRRTVV